MIINPARIEFENSDDIIDYVSKGFPPSKKHFYELMDKVEYPDSISDYARYSPKAGKQVIVTERIIPEEERATYEYILSRVYHNRVKRRNKRIALGIVIGLGLIIGGGRKKSSDHDSVSEGYDFCDCPDVEDIDVEHF